MSDPLPVWAWVLVALGGLCLLLIAVGLLRDPPHFPLDGKVFVITGGSSGIGKAAAKYLLQKGANVALWARRKDVLDAARAELLESRRDGTAQRISVHVVDVVNETACLGAAASVLEAHGAVHGLIASAGISEPVEFSKQAAGTFERVLRVNVVGVRNAIFALLPALRRAGLSAREGARICVVSSTIGFLGFYGYTAYAASKFAITGLMQALQQELRPWNIRGCIFMPTSTDTPLFTSENESKPKLTAKIEGTSPVMSPEDTARECVLAIQRGQFLAQMDTLTWLISTMSSGMSPAPTMREFLPQLLLPSPIKVVAAFFHLFADMDIDSEAAAVRAEQATLDQGYAGLTTRDAGSAGKEHNE